MKTREQRHSRPSFFRPAASKRDKSGRRRWKISLSSVIPAPPLKLESHQIQRLVPAATQTESFLAHAIRNEAEALVHRDGSLVTRYYVQFQLFELGRAGTLEQ